MKKFLIICLFAMQSAWCLNLQDFHGKSFSFQWDRTEDFEAATELFMKSFLGAYASASPEELGVENKEDFLREAIDEEIALVFERDDIHWLIAKKEDQVIGLLILELAEYPKVIYGRQMAIDPERWRTHLGSQMAQVVALSLPEAKKFVAITRIFNERSMEFFKSLGFQRSEYMHEGYDSDRYAGFEIILRTE